MQPLRVAADGRNVDHTVISPLTITIAGAVLLLVAIAGLTTRRLRANSRFEMGSVSQQWLLGHKDEV
jgi:hypothetical protein